MSTRQQLRISTEASARLPDGRNVVVTATRTVVVGQPAPVDDGPTYSQGFASVRWRGKLYWLRDEQCLVVAHLWEAAEAGEPFVRPGALLEVADVEHVGRVKDLFRDSDAWGELVVAGPVCGGPVGTYCLAWASKE